MTKLTKIERLDQQFPGLADQVRKWFTQGISCEKVGVLLAERYPLAAPVSHSTVAAFRSKRWVPEMEMFREKKIAALAAQEVAREREIKAAFARQARGDVA
jgi:hypothetical protein